MREDQKPYQIILTMVKNRTKLKDWVISETIRAGKAILEEREKKEKPNVWDRIYDDFDLPEDLPRKLRDLKKLQLKDFCGMEPPQRKCYNQFVHYCSMLSEGLGAEPSLKMISDSIQRDLQLYLTTIQEFVANYNLTHPVVKEKDAPAALPPEGTVNLEPAEENSAAQAAGKAAAHAAIMHHSTKAEEGRTTLLDIRVVKLNELMETFLDEMNMFHAESTWEHIANHAEYDRFIVMKKQTTFRFNSDYGDMVFTVFEAPVENNVYVISLGPMDDEVEVVTYERMEEAISAIMEFIHSNHDYALDHLERTYTKTYELADGVTHTERYSYDTLSSISDKIAKLLS